MARRKRLMPPYKKQQVSNWLQIFVAVWMLGVLFWFFMDYKIQQWLAMILADLFSH